MSDKEEIREAIAALAIHVDGRNWDKLKQLFAPIVQVDYTSLFGGEKETVEIDTLVGRWAAFLPTFTGTIHMIGAPLIEAEANGAKAQAPVVAWHSKADGSMWVIGGHYDIDLTKADTAWRISELTLHALFQQGCPS